MEVFERILGVGFFHYGPRLWMVGEVEPLKSLQDKNQRGSIIERIIAEYPKKEVTSDQCFYRVRKSPENPSEPPH